MLIIDCFGLLLFASDCVVCGTASPLYTCVLVTCVWNYKPAFYMCFGDLRFDLVGDGVAVDV